MTAFIFKEARTWYRLRKPYESSGRQFGTGQLFWPGVQAAEPIVESTEAVPTHMAVSLSIDGTNVFLVPVAYVERCHGLTVEL